MMREIEKIFQTMKDDFNQRISNLSIFTNSDDSIESHIVNAGGSILDEYDQISLNGYDINENESLMRENHIPSNIFETDDFDLKSTPLIEDDIIAYTQELQNSMEMEMSIIEREESLMTSVADVYDNENQLETIGNNNKLNSDELNTFSENIAIFQDDQTCVTIESGTVDMQTTDNNDNSININVGEEHDPKLRDDNENLSDIDEKPDVTPLKDENEVIVLENEIANSEEISERENIDANGDYYCIAKPPQIEHTENILPENELTNIIEACQQIELINDVESSVENNIVKETEPNQVIRELEASNDGHEKISVESDEESICVFKGSEDLVIQLENEANDFLAEYEQVEMQANLDDAFIRAFGSEQLSDSENNHESDKSEHASSGIDSRLVDEIKSEKAACSLLTADTSKPYSFYTDKVMDSPSNEDNSYQKTTQTFSNDNKKARFAQKSNPAHLEKKPKHKSQTQQSNNIIARKGATEMSNSKKPSKQSPTSRKMWSEMLEVIESNYLRTLSKNEIQLQEAMFEIITSENSYFQSLMTLTSHFFDSSLFKISEDKESVVTVLDKHHIFSNVILIARTSKNLLNDLEQRWHDEKPVLTNICDVVLNHVNSDDFQNYVTYLRNQQYQTKALKRLSENEYFKQQLSYLESSSECGKLSLDSYLMLPMQRLTRLKLLVEAVSNLQNSEELKHKVKTSCKQNSSDALEKIKKLLSTSNTEKGLMDQKGALISLINRIDFPQSLKRITFSERIFIREDELRIHQHTPLKIMKRISRKKQPFITLLLFNDLLMITKKKSGRLLVLDYGSKNKVEAKSKFCMKDNSSNEVSSNTSTHDVNSESTSPLKSIGPTLSRSKTSLSSDEKKRLSIPLSNTFISMPSINEIECKETSNQTFTLQLKDSISGIFISPVLLTAKNREERDLWLSYLSKDSLMTEDIYYHSRSSAPKLQKSKSLKSNSNFSNIPTNSKRYSYKKSKDERKTLININKFLEVKDVLLNSIKITSL